MAPPAPPDVALLLRAATTPAERGKAVSAALDRLATTLSTPETQRLLRALREAHVAGPEFRGLLPRLTQVASVCSVPPRKAACVGHALVEALVAHVASTSGHPEALEAAQRALLAVFQANPSVTSGVLSALENFASDDQDETTMTTAISVARPMLVAALVDAASPPQRAVHKLAVLQTLVRAAWATPDAAVRGPITHNVLVRAVALTPLTTHADAWVVYPALVAATVDLLVAGAGTPDDALDVAQAVLRRVAFGLDHDLDVVSLLQSLLEIAAAAPREICTSSVVFQLGAVLLHAQSAEREQTLVLRILSVLLDTITTRQPRSVYVEALVVPLVAVQATHPKETPALLQLVLDTVCSAPFQHADANSTPALGVNAAHAASYLALATSAGACEAWLQSLFLGDKNREIQDASSTLLMQLGACLVDRRGGVRALALDVLERQVTQRRVHKNADWPQSSVKLLVSTLVVLTSYRPANVSFSDQSWLSRAFQVLASLAATTTETMKIVLRLIKRMATAAPSLQSQALHLMLLVWKQDSRVYPQLEGLLNQAGDREEDEDEESDDDADIVRMATILAVCEKDPETGVEWVADVQRYLEHACVSVVAMAVRAVALLCIADCLDYETTVKMFVVKMKKNKIGCAEDPLFQQELCKLYAFGGACDFVESSPKYSARVLSDLWEYAEVEDASVRLEAFIALNSYTLEALGLRLIEKGTTKAQYEEDEDEEELTEQDVEENVDRVWAYMQTEEDERVRNELEKLVEKILDAESKKLAPGGASRTGTGVASAASFAALEQRISAAATKELKKILPTRETLVQQVDQVVGWSAYLLVYEPANVVESGAAAKRRDKRLRIVMGQVDEMKSVLERCLSSSVATTASASKDSSPCHFLQLLQSVDAWNSFARKYFGRLEELAVLRTPMDAPEGHTAEVLSNLIDEQVTSLVGGSSTHSQRWLVLGAILYQACKSASSDGLEGAITKARATVRTQLQQSMEELRVFKDAAHAVDVQHLLLGLALAYPTHTDSHLDAILARVASVVTSDSSDLTRAAAVLFVSHASSLVRKLETRAEQQQRIQSGMECAVSVLLRAIFGNSAAGLAAKIFADTTDVAKMVEQVKASSTTDRAKESPVLAWASAIGLAQLSQCLAAVHRLMWLDSLRVLLESTWGEDSTLSGAVALGPVLLESVHHNRISITTVQAFTSTLQRRLDEAPAETIVIGAIVLPYVMQRVAACGYASSRNDVEAFVQSIACAQESASAAILSVAAGNLLHGSTGVTLFGAAASPEREVTVETVHVQSLIDAINKLKTQDQVELSTAAAFALAAISDRADSFYVGQKNKTFDVQLNTLPATSLVFKTLEFLRSGGASSTDATAVVRASPSVLRCVAHASRSFPLPLDLAALAIRVASRYAQSDAVLAACIDLAASHASGVSLLMTNLLSPERLLNYSPRVVESSVDAVVSARGRLTSQQLVVLLTRTFDALVEAWRRDGLASTVSTGFEKWFKLVGSLVETVTPKPDEATAAEDHGGALALTVSALVQNEFVAKLPFTPDHDASATLIRQFARDVLAKITPRPAVTDALLASTTQPGDVWAWWRVGVAVSELLRLGSLVSSSVVFRWLLQLDFSCIESASVVDVFTADLVDAVCTAAGKKSAIEVNEPWLLELLDAIARTNEDRDRVSALQRRVFFATVESVLAWTELRGHEVLVLRGDATGLARSAVVASLVALGARAIRVHHHERSGATVSIAQRLWTLHTGGHASDTVLRELYVIASESRPQLLSSDTEKALVTQLSME